MAKVTADNLSAAVSQMLQKYADDEVTPTVKQKVEAVAKTAVSGLRSSSRSTFGGSGKYASGWTTTKEADRFGMSITIHNTYPGLPHLLEHGHANRGGGRTPGREHIKPIEEAAIQALEKEITEGL